MWSLALTRPQGGVCPQWMDGVFRLMPPLIPDWPPIPASQHQDGDTSWSMCIHCLGKATQPAQQEKYVIDLGCILPALRWVGSHPSTHVLFAPGSRGRMNLPPAWAGGAHLTTPACAWIPAETCQNSPFPAIHPAGKYT
jgi:hypothetical protein